MPHGSANHGSPITALASAFDHALDNASRLADAGHHVAGLVSPTLPWELFRAAGYTPVYLRAGVPPADDGRLEANVFSARIRTLFEQAVSGAWKPLRLVGIARSSEPDYKLHLYLREVVREGSVRDLPPLLFYDLLHSNTVSARDYGRARTVALRAALEGLSGRAITDETLTEACTESNAARSAHRRLQQLRLGNPRLSSGMAARLLGAFHVVPRADYARLAAAAAEALNDAPVRSGPRLLLTGASPDTPRLHDALDSLGAVVVAEDGPWGARAAGRDIDTGDTGTLDAIFDHYYAGTPCPRRDRSPGDDAWLEEVRHSGLDGAVVVLPPEDSVEGWSAPGNIERLTRMEVPTFVLRGDTSEPLPSPLLQQLTAFIHAVRSRRG